jgi:hypothetical protein
MRGNAPERPGGFARTARVAGESAARVRVVFFKRNLPTRVLSHHAMPF